MILMRRLRETLYPSPLPGSLDLTLTPSSYYEEYVPNGIWNGTINAVGSNGTPPYTYLWANVSGANQVQATLPLNSQNMAFTCSGTNTARRSVWTCTVTDSVGATLTKTCSVSVGFNQDLEPGPEPPPGSEIP